MCGGRTDSTSNRNSLVDRQTIALHGTMVARLGDIDEEDAKMNSLTHHFHHENLNRIEGDFC